MYDAIVIGARCAGAPTAMLLARQGHRVLLVDRATFPSDTMSTHVIHPQGLAALRRWGLLDDLIASGVTALPTLRLDFGPVVLEGTPPDVDGISEHYARVQRATRVEGFVGSGRIPNHFRQSYGAGWALVGDAAYHKDPIGAHGITDAFLDAERVAAAVHAGLTCKESMGAALRDCQAEREETSLALFELNAQFAALDPTTPELQAVIAALAGNQAEAERFVGAVTGTVSVAEFFAAENLASIIGGASGSRAARTEARVA